DTLPPLPAPDSASDRRQIMSALDTIQELLDNRQVKDLKDLPDLLRLERETDRVLRWMRGAGAPWLAKYVPHADPEILSRLLETLGARARVALPGSKNHPILMSGVQQYRTAPPWVPEPDTISLSMRDAYGLLNNLRGPLSADGPPPDGPAPPNLLYWQGV